MNARILSLSTLAVAALALFSCQKAELELNNTVKGTPFAITLNADATKTANDGIATNWEADDSVSVFHAEAGTTNYGTNDGFGISSADLATGTFRGTLSAALDDTKSYDWYVIYPHTNKLTTPANETCFYRLGSYSKNTAQVQEGNNSTAHLSGQYFPLIGKVTGVAGSAVPQIAMRQALAVVKVHVTNTLSTPLTVTSVSFAAPEDIAGSYYIKFNGDAPEFTPSGDSYVATTANLTVNDGEAISQNGSADFYIAIKPFEAKSGNELSLFVNGVSKSVTLTSSCTFEAGVIKTLNYSYENANGNTSTEANPYSVADAYDFISGLAAGVPVPDVYVKGIVSRITNAYNSSYHNVSFNISDDGVDSGELINVYRAPAASATTYEVGDAVLLKGNGLNFNGTKPELDAGATCVAQVKAPVISPNGGSFTGSQSVTITASDGATIYYTTDGSTPTTSSSVYSSSLNLTATTTVKAIAVKDGLTTGVVSETYTKSDGGAIDYYKLVTSLDDITEGKYVIGALKSTSATNKFYFGTATVSSGDWTVEGTGLTVNEDAGVRKFVVSKLPTNAVEFTFTGDNTNGFTISSGDDYLYCTDWSSNRKLAFGSDGSSCKWIVAAKDTPLITGGVYLSAVLSEGSYTVSENSTANGAIRGYASKTVYRAIYLFKKVTE